MENRFDVLVIGGGIVGLSTAFQLAKRQPGLKIAVVEKEKQLAFHQTGHNSGVIHSGLYYKPGSLKAQNCIDGYQMLIDFADEHHISYDLCGKIVVATLPEELPRLKNLYQRGIANGLHKIRKIGPDEIKDFEPHCAGLAGLWVPYTGIIDYVEVAEKYAHLLQSQFGGEIFMGQKVVGLKTVGDGVQVNTPDSSFFAKQVVNCAGLYSDAVASYSVPNLDVRIIPFRGEYYYIKPEKQYLVKNLIYPVPDPAFPFLGVHFTRMIGGGVEAGPNAVFALKKEGYKKTDINFSELAASLAWPGFQKVALKYWKTGMGEIYRSFSKSAFTKALQRLIPEIEKEDLLPAEAGVRAQACHRTEGLLDDFMILETERVVNVCNAPSPAATSSLSIGRTVAEKVANKFDRH
jgi:(S)-2-hydroxyglutarate dehydrogenase